MRATVADHAVVILKGKPANCPADVPEDVPPFKYRGFGSLAYIGSGTAVIDPVKSASVLGYIRCALKLRVSVHALLQAERWQTGVCMPGNI